MENKIENKIESSEVSVEKPKEEEGRLGLLKGIRESAWAKATAVLAVGLSMAALSKKQVEGAQKTSTSVSESAADRIPMSEAKGTTEQNKYPWPGGHLTFFEYDQETKSAKFNPWSLLAPVQLEFSKEIEGQHLAGFDVPYEYSRLFDTGKPLRGEDHQKIAEYINKELQQKIGEVLYGLDMNKRVYQLKHGESIKDASSIKINDVYIMGYSSPEGPATKGPSSIKPYNIDDENISLAKKRANEASIITYAELEKIVGPNADKKVLEDKAIISANELQFSEEEMKELASLAQEQVGVDDLEKIFNLTVDYNDGKVVNKAILDRLDRIIGAKRMVNIDIDTAGKQKKTLIIPIPWLLLLPLAIPALKRRKKNPPRTFISDPPEFIPPEAPPKPDGKSIKIIIIPETFKKVVLPPEGTPEYEMLEEKTFTDDLYVFFDDHETMVRGLNYRAIADSYLYLSRIHAFEKEEEMKIAIAQDILKAWQAHDISARKEAGVSQDQLEVGLDYVNQPEQVKWSKMHAQALSQLIKEKQANPNADYLDLLTPKVRKMIQRRVFRERK